MTISVENADFSTINAPVECELLSNFVTAFSLKKPRVLRHWKVLTKRKTVSHSASIEHTQADRQIDWLTDWLTGWRIDGRTEIPNRYRASMCCRAIKMKTVNAACAEETQTSQSNALILCYVRCRIGYWMNRTLTQISVISQPKVRTWNIPNCPISTSIYERLAHMTPNI